MSPWDWSLRVWNGSSAKLPPTPTPTTLTYPTDMPNLPATCLNLYIRNISSKDVVETYFGIDRSQPMGMDGFGWWVGPEGGWRGGCA